MITTITLNPSVDRRYVVQDFQVGNLFRTHQFEATAGGKGLNVARVIKQFGEDVLTTGFIGGKNGEFILEQLTEQGIKNDFIQITGETRNCIAILSKDVVQTEILESGPKVTSEQIELFLQKYERILQDSSVLVASGSLPEGVPESMYYELIIRAKKKGKPFILDTSGSALREGLNASPFLIKPNKSELELLMNRPIESEEEIIKAAKEISQNGVEFVVVSLGSDGAIIIHKDLGYKVKIPKIEVKNPVGSGDSMVAGLAIGLYKNYGIEDMLKLGVACGTANAMEIGTGQIRKANVESMFKNVKVEKIKVLNSLK
ncbi:1-phosphofructokinase [Tepidibacillus fermentans]|uniref:Tagatose-6-phosphate kinase n=1 Tax=Tepidibacillus fermentans TaxID=1281767 RepID=A0A4R3KEY4_9BACI|nr:1-phosphofructokinase [Tepidibacillus fermentans]TCS81818.1 tagatose 6-phosphate kinase [Tepidibacillus fermentans]